MAVVLAVEMGEKQVGGIVAQALSAPPPVGRVARRHGGGVGFLRAPVPVAPAVALDVFRGLHRQVVLEFPAHHGQNGDGPPAQLLQGGQVPARRGLADDIGVGRDRRAEAGHSYAALASAASRFRSARQASYSFMSPASQARTAISKGVVLPILAEHVQRGLRIGRLLGRGPEDGHDGIPDRPMQGAPRSPRPWRRFPKKPRAVSSPSGPTVPLHPEYGLRGRRRQGMREALPGCLGLRRGLRPPLPPARKRPLTQPLPQAGEGFSRPCPILPSPRRSLLPPPSLAPDRSPGLAREGRGRRHAASRKAS